VKRSLALITCLVALVVLGASVSPGAEANTKKLLLCETLPCNKPSEAPVGTKASEEMKLTSKANPAARKRSSAK
jgi:hypothetical protein